MVKSFLTRAGLRLIAGLTGAAVLAGCELPPQTTGGGITTAPPGGFVRTQQRALNDRELRALLSGRTIKQTDDQFTATFLAGGQLRSSYYNTDQTGSYSIANGQVCQRFDQWNAGRSTCYVVFESGGRYRFHDPAKNDGYSFVIVR